jgi:hypothetical protein
MLISETANEISSRITSLNGRQRRYVVGHEGTVADPVPGCSYYVTNTLTVTGSFQDGFSGSVETKEEHHTCNRDGARGGNHSAMLDGGSGKLQRVNFEVPSTGPVDNLINIPIPSVPPFIASPQEIVNIFNHDRIAIYELMALNGQQRQLAVEMTRARDALGSKSTVS